MSSEIMVEAIGPYANEEEARRDVERLYPGYEAANKVVYQIREDGLIDVIIDVEAAPKKKGSYWILFVIIIAVLILMKGKKK